MKLPNLHEAERALSAIKQAEYTMGCASCHKPLWKISNIKRYGTKTSADKEAFPGVPEYNDLWSANGRECKDLSCPFCGECFVKLIRAGEHVFPKPYVLEFDGA